MVLKINIPFPDRIDPQEASPATQAPGRVVPLACKNLGEGNRPRSWSIPVTRFRGEGHQILPDKPLVKRAEPHRCNSTFGAATLGNPELNLTLIETRMGGLAGPPRRTNARLTSRTGNICDLARSSSLIYV